MALECSGKLLAYTPYCNERGRFEFVTWPWMVGDEEGRVYSELRLD